MTMVGYQVALIYKGGGECGCIEIKLRVSKNRGTPKS